MILSNLIYAYVRDIPWKQDPAFAEDTETYINTFRIIVKNLPDKKNQISFLNDVWDFSPYLKDSNTTNCIFHFNIVSPELRKYLKFFVLHKSMEKTKLSTICIHMKNATNVINCIMRDTPHNSLSLITTDDLCNEISRRNSSQSITHSNFKALYSLFCFLINSCKFDLPVDVEVLKQLGTAGKGPSKEEADRPVDIPEEYFDVILEKAVSMMRDKTSDYNERATACVIVILSQSGLRIEDLMNLTTDCLLLKKLPKSGRASYYIHYNSYIPDKFHNSIPEFDIFSNSLCTEAVTTLKKLRNNCEFSRKPYLYVLDLVCQRNVSFPLPSLFFRHEFERFLQKNLLKKASVEWPGIKTRAYTIKIGKKKQHFNLAIPDTRQFQVHLCMILLSKGIPLVYIQKYLGHLSEYILGYYSRPKNTYRENILYSEKIIKEIAGDDLIPIGLMGSDLHENIKLFINVRKLDVKTDIHGIMDALINKLIIRSIPGGACIKTLLMPCALEAKTDEITFSCGLCPNFFHFYYMADVSYLDFITLQTLYEEDLSAEHMKAAQKELQKIKELLNRKLTPELDELEHEIALKGKEYIIIRNPSLIPIIDNLSNIREEIKRF